MSALPSSGKRHHIATFCFSAFVAVYSGSLYMWHTKIDFNSLYQPGGVFLANPLATGTMVATAALSILTFSLSLRSGQRWIIEACYWLWSMYPILVRLSVPGILTPPDMPGFAGSAQQISFLGHVQRSYVADEVATWPVASVLWAAFSLVTSIDSFVANGILLIAIGLLVASSLLIIARLIDETYAPLIALFALALTRNQYALLGFFVDSYYGTALMFLITAFLFKEVVGSFHTSRRSIIFVILAPALVFGHGLWAIFLSCFLLFSASLTRSALRNRALFCMILLSAHAVYSGTAYLAEILQRALSLDLGRLAYGLRIVQSGQAYASYGYLPVVNETIYGKLLSTYLIFQSDSIIGFVFALAVVGTIKLRKTWRPRIAIFFRFSWVYFFSVAGVIFVSVFSPDPGFLPRPIAYSMALIAAIAATSLLVSPRMRGLLPTLSVVFLISLFSVGISSNPIVNVPSQKFIAETFYYENATKNGCQLSLDSAFFGPEMGYFDPRLNFFQFIPSTNPDSWTFLTVVRYFHNHAPMNLIRNDGLFVITLNSKNCA